MADELTLKAVIEAVLDAKGFEEFKMRLGEAGVAANRASAGFGQLGEGTERLSKRVTSVGLNILTNQMLVSAGAATGFARVIASGAATIGGFTATLGPWGAALAAAAAAGALLAGRMQGSKEATAKAAEAAREHAKNVQQEFERLDDLRREIGQLTPALENLLSVKRELAEQARRDAIRATIEELFAVRAQIQTLKDQTTALLDLARARAVLLASIEAITAKISENAAAVQKLTQRERELVGELNAEREARAGGARDRDQQVELLKKDAEARDRGFKSAEAERRAKAAVRSEDRQGAADREAEFRRQREMAEKREDALRRHGEQRRKQKDDAKAARADDLLLETEAQKAKRQLDTETFANAASLLSAAFPRNKALAVAAAVINTFEGATKALAQGGFAGIALAAAVIAFGLAQVAKIRETEAAGFDLPESDLLARKMGVRWADDLLRNINAGFMGALAGRPAPGGSFVQQVRNTNVHNGPSFAGGVTVSGFFGAGRTDILKTLNRELIRIGRLETRTRLA